MDIDRYETPTIDDGKLQYIPRNEIGSRENDSKALYTHASSATVVTHVRCLTQNTNEIKL